MSKKLDWLSGNTWSDDEVENDAVERVVNTYSVDDLANVDLTKLNSQELRDVATFANMLSYKKSYFRQIWNCE